MAMGAKRIETRSWRTAYRGPLAIHAAKGMPAWAVDICCEDLFQEALALDAEPGQLPRGCVLAVGRLVACEGTELATQGRLVTRQEAEFGDFTPGRFAWHIRDVLALPSPIPAKGALQLWEWQPPPEIAQWLRAHGWAG